MTLKITFGDPGAKKLFINEISFFTDCCKSLKNWVLRTEPGSLGKADIFSDSFLRQVLYTYDHPGTQYLTQTGLKTQILLTFSSKFWDYKTITLYPGEMFFKNDPTLNQTMQG